MGVYIYQNPKTGETVEIFQSINDKHEYVNENGVKYDRVFTIPHAAIDSQIDPFSSKDFARKTRDKSMSMGDLWDASETASKKRERVNGKDPLKENHFKNYSKLRKGMKHQSDPSRSE